jgi:AcrR family transcriptional regulator
MPSTSTLVKEHTRIRILKSARRLIEERGFNEVGLEQVAAGAGVSRQAVYLHFASKVGLLLDLVDYVDQMEGLEPLRDSVWSADSGRQALDSYIHLFLTLTPRVLAVALALEAVRRSDSAAMTAWADRARRRWATCKRVAQLLTEEDCLRDGITQAEAADLLWAMTSAHAYVDLMIERRWTKRRVSLAIRGALTAGPSANRR